MSEGRELPADREVRSGDAERYREQDVPPERDEVRLSLQELESIATRALLAAGCSRRQAVAIARTVTAAEGDGSRSHGLFRIPFYVRVIRENGAVPDAQPKLEENAPAVLRVDGGMGFAPLALELGLPALGARARELGMAALAVNRVFHIAALWHEVEALAEEGLVGFAFTASVSHIPPAGGRRPLFGTNPMAFAWPRDGRPPVVFDQASSARARGEILLHQREGEPLPDGWALDPEGRPTNDPAAALAGAQLPFGGYKGASIALMVELLAGGLIDDLFSFETKERDRAGIDVGPGGELVVAMDPMRFAPDGDAGPLLAHAERLFARMLEEEGVRLPGARRHRERGRSREEGVLVPRALVEEVRALGD